jgi:hypothetical protein
MFFTLGAGPSLFGALRSDVNRPKDTAGGQVSAVVDPGSQGEDAAIGKLLAADANYRDNLPYGSPNIPSDYNSNSYASGILRAAGLTVPVLPVPLPLYTNPIPSTYFAPR